MKYKQKKGSKNPYFPKKYKTQEEINHLETLFEEMKQEYVPHEDVPNEKGSKETGDSISNKKGVSLEKIYAALERIKSEYNLTLKDLEHFDEHSFPDESYLNEIRNKQENYLCKLKKEYQKLVNLLEDSGLSVPSCYNLEAISVNKDYFKKSSYCKAIQLPLFPEKKKQKALFALKGFDIFVSLANNYDDTSGKNEDEKNSSRSSEEPTIQKQLFSSTPIQKKLF